MTGAGERLTLIARVREPSSGRTLEVWSTEPAVQFYTAIFSMARYAESKASPYGQYGGFTLETQHFPDSVNHANFPSYMLKPGATYHSTAIFRFSAN